MINFFLESEGEGFPFDNTLFYFNVVGTVLLVKGIMTIA